jgi:hypothetical protein
LNFGRFLADVHSLLEAREEESNPQASEWRGSLLYHTEFLADCTCLSLTLMHFTHIWY